MKLELAQQVIDGWCVGEGHDGAIPGWRVGLAAAANLAPGFGLAAAWAGLSEIDLRPLRCAVGADELVVVTGFAAEHTGGWEQDALCADEPRA